MTWNDLIEVIEKKTMYRDSLISKYKDYAKNIIKKCDLLSLGFN